LTRKKDILCSTKTKRNQKNKQPKGEKKTNNGTGRLTWYMEKGGQYGREKIGKKLRTLGGGISGKGGMRIIYTGEKRGPNKGRGGQTI